MSANPSLKGFPRQRDFSFACGGWLMNYLFGVAECLMVHGLTKNSKVVGSSAGALAATGIALEADFIKVMRHAVNKSLPECQRDIQGPFQLKKYVSDCLDECGELHKYVRLRGQLEISVTHLPTFTNRRIKNFPTAESLKTALLASCCATPLAGLPFFREGSLLMDGGVSDFQPVFDSSTITVNPFYFSRADIKPSRYVPAWWAIYPPSADNYWWVFQLGYNDTLHWMKESDCGHLSCQRITHFIQQRDHQFLSHTLSHSLPPLRRPSSPTVTLTYSNATIDHNAKSHSNESAPSLPASHNPLVPSNLPNLFISQSSSSSQPPLDSQPLPETETQTSFNVDKLQELYESSIPANNIDTSSSILLSSWSPPPTPPKKSILPSYYINEEYDEDDNGNKNYISYEWKSFHCKTTRCQLHQQRRTKRMSEKSFRRFFGYSVTSPLLSAFLDFFLTIMVLLLWRPVAFSLIYWELLLRTLLYTIKALLYSVILNFMSFLHGVLLLFSFQRPKYALARAESEWLKVRHSIRSVFSFSLFLYAVPIVGSIVQQYNLVKLNKHPLLIQHSLIYRLTVHFLH